MQMEPPPIPHGCTSPSLRRTLPSRSELIIYVSPGTAYATSGNSALDANLTLSTSRCNVECINITREHGYNGSRSMLV